MADVSAKYDQLAEKFAERSYANLPFYMHRRCIITTKWGVLMQSSDTVLELGCGDGYLAQLLLQRGVHYCGLDISQGMIAMAEQRARAAGLAANATFVVTDIQSMALTEPFDIIVSYMRTFFAYVHEPDAVLQRLRPWVRKKLIIDLDPRRDLSLREALALLRRAGFRHVTWRPFFVPQDKHLPLWFLRVLCACEGLPFVRSMLLRWKFHCLLKAEP
jgi:SAM-dependent methyltransferase